MTVKDFVQNFIFWSDRERPQSRCVCRERDGGPHSLLSTWDGGIIDDMPRSEGHLTGRLSRLVVKDPLLCMCLWETLMFIYRGKAPENCEKCHTIHKITITQSPSWRIITCVVQPTVQHQGITKVNRLNRWDISVLTKVVDQLRTFPLIKRTWTIY